MIRGVEFSVADVETTGLFPKGVDRIIEIAVIRLNAKGEILDEYATLVNPHRDIGPTHIHGIRARDVKKAPTFAEVAGDVLSRLKGAVFVAHNVYFDMRFVQSEMARLGHRLPDFAFLCTMQLARKADPTIPSRRLGELCRYFGIRQHKAHSAYGDARATVELLTMCLARLAGTRDLSLAEIGVQGHPIGGDAWPSLPRCGVSYRREQAAEDISSEPSYIARLVARLPASSESVPEIEEYLLLLDKVLEDRRVTAEEAEALLSLSAEVGISRDQAIRAHHTYMRDLIRVALQDGVITEAERRDLEEVRKLLSIAGEHYRRLLVEVENERTRAGSSSVRLASSRTDIEGKSVCFTGALQCRVDGEIATRSLAEQIAAENGMIVKRTVSRTLDYLVTADPDSMSGKARKARERGVRIIVEPVFWGMVGVEIE
jgi:DNA polymerase-3 subunit epsilon